MCVHVYIFIEIFIYRKSYCLYEISYTWNKLKIFKVTFTFFFSQVYDHICINHVKINITSYFKLDQRKRFLCKKYIQSEM